MSESSLLRETFDEIPSNWKGKRLKYLASIQFSNVNKTIEDGEEVVCLCNYIDVYKNDYIVSELEFMKASASKEEIRKFSLFMGDVLLTKDSETADDIGIPAIVSEDIEKLICGYHLAILRCSPCIYGSFLFRFLQSRIIASYFEQRANGITRFAIGLDTVGSCPIIFPSLPVQKAIASYLDKETARIDALIELKERQIELLQEKRQAIITRAITKGLNPNVKMKDSGVEWIGEIPEKWEVRRLKYVKMAVKNSFVDGPFGSNLKSEHFIDNGDIYVIESNFATTGLIDENLLKTISFEHFLSISRSECSENDVIISKIGANYGMASVLPKLTKRSVVSGNSLKLTLNTVKISINYFLYYWEILKKSGYISLISQSTAQPALNLYDLNTMPVLVPDLMTQNEIVYKINTIDTNIKKNLSLIERSITLLNEYRSSLITSSVSGQIDISQEEP